MRAIFAGIAAFFGILLVGALVWCLLNGMVTNGCYDFHKYNVAGWIIFVIYSCGAFFLAGCAGFDVWEKESD